MTTATNHANTAQEILIAELLGDIGRLHDEIKALPESLAPTVGAIINAATSSRAVIDEYVVSHRADMQKFIQHEKMILQDSLKTAIHAEAGTALAETVQALHLSVVAHQQATKRQRFLFLEIALTALSAGIIGGVIGFCGAFLLHTL